MAPAIPTTRPIPVTCFTGFLGAGKTTAILGLIKQLPPTYKVVLLKNEYGDVEVDSLLAKESNITGVSEILNGCLCCTMVGLVENALLEIRDTMQPDRIIIESSGSAFPATLALRIRELESKGFKLDGVVTVIDCVNFTGYEDDSPSAKLQARYTDLLLLSKHQLLNERQLDILSDHLGTLNDETPRIYISAEKPPTPDLIFGLDTQLFNKQDEEAVDWEKVGSAAGWHGDEVETVTVWNGERPGRRKAGENEHGHSHPEGEMCVSCGQHDDDRPHKTPSPISRGMLTTQLEKLSSEIYRVKGIVRLESDGAEPPFFILNYAFGRYDLTPMTTHSSIPDLEGVGVRLTMMGERGEVKRRAKRFADALGAQMA